MSSGRTKKTLVCAVSGSTWIRIVTYASCVERTNGARLDTNGAVLARHDKGLASEIRDCLVTREDRQMSGPLWLLRRPREVRATRLSRQWNARFDTGNQAVGVLSLVNRTQAGPAGTISAGLVVDPWHPCEQLDHPDVARVQATRTQVVAHVALQRDRVRFGLRSLGAKDLAVPLAERGNLSVGEDGLLAIPGHAVVAYGLVIDDVVTLIESDAAVVACLIMNAEGQSGVGVVRGGCDLVEQDRGIDGGLCHDHAVAGGLQLRFDQFCHRKHITHLWFVLVPGNVQTGDRVDSPDCRAVAGIDHDDGPPGRWHRGPRGPRRGLRMARVSNHAGWSVARRVCGRDGRRCRVGRRIPRGT